MMVVSGSQGSFCSLGMWCSLALNRRGLVSCRATRSLVTPARPLLRFPGVWLSLDRDTGKLPPSFAECCPQPLVSCLSTSTFLISQAGRVPPTPLGCLGVVVVVP